MLEFDTAIQEVVDDAKSLEVKVDGRKIKVYQPSDGQLAMLLATIGRGSSEVDKIAGAINFFCAVLEDADSLWIETRLLDRRDPFGIDEVQRIMEALIEEWSGRPTQPLSVSSPSPESTGPKLTQPTSESNSSGFPPIGS